MIGKVHKSSSGSLRILQSIVRSFDAFTETVGKAVSWLTLAMVLVACIVVLLRRVFGVGSIALQELVTYMHAAVFLLGAAYGLKHRSLVRVDILYRKFSPRAKAWVDSLGAVVFLLPFCIFVAWISWDFVVSAWQVREVSTDAGGLIFVYIHKSIIILFALTLCLQGFTELLRALLVLMTQSTGDDERDD